MRIIIIIIIIIICTAENGRSILITSYIRRERSFLRERSFRTPRTVVPVYVQILNDKSDLYLATVLGGADNNK